MDARVDFDWEEYGASGEFDGKDKYGRLLRPGRTTGEAVMFEKAREEVVRRHGRWIFRWNDAEVKEPKIFKRIIENGLANGLRRHRGR